MTKTLPLGALLMAALVSVPALGTPAHRRPAAHKRANDAGWKRATMPAYRGVRAADAKVVDSDDRTADFSFPIHPTSMNLSGPFGTNAPTSLPYPYLDAPKAKGYDSAPDVSKITQTEAETWKDYANVIAPGRWFLVRSGTGRFYEIHILSFADKTKDYHFWKITAAWRPVTLRP